MAFFTLTHPVPGRFAPGRRHLFEQVKDWQFRLSAAWTRHRTQQALESLPYDMLKDIGFPAANAVQDSKAP